ncbi:MAG: hypothetical protein V1773_14875 [bacterium]
MVELTNHSRKHVIRKLNYKETKTSNHVKKRGRKSKYNNPAIKDFILDLWKQTQFICSRRLKEAIKVWLPYSTNAIPENIKELLLIISSSSIERILSEYRNKYAPNRMCTTKPGSLLKKQIPIHSNKWDDEKPGFVEADTVAHGGTSCSGSFVHSVVITDIATGWVETMAVWEKGQRNVHTTIMSIEERLPFSILGFDSDNETEFINNYFIPSEQLKEKLIRNGKIYKIMSTAKTPYQRLTEKLKLKQEQLNIHNEILRNNNPYKLIITIKLKIKSLYNDYEKYLMPSGERD